MCVHVCVCVCVRVSAGVSHLWPRYLSTVGERLADSRISQAMDRIRLEIAAHAASSGACVDDVEVILAYGDGQWTGISGVSCPTAKFRDALVRICDRVWWCCVLCFMILVFGFCPCFWHLCAHLQTSPQLRSHSRSRRRTRRQSAPTAPASCLASRTCLADDLSTPPSAQTASHPRESETP